MTRAIILAVIIGEGIGIGYFGGYLSAAVWFIFWALIALWSACEMMMVGRNGS